MAAHCHGQNQVGKSPMLRLIYIQLTNPGTQVGLQPTIKPATDVSVTPFEPGVKK
jgi:hypothetical protein